VTCFGTISHSGTNDNSQTKAMTAYRYSALCAGALGRDQPGHRREIAADLPSTQIHGIEGLTMVGMLSFFLVMESRIAGLIALFVIML
jgi:hypothetical protein